MGMYPRSMSSSRVIKSSGGRPSWLPSEKSRSTFGSSSAERKSMKSASSRTSTRETAGDRVEFGERRRQSFTEHVELSNVVNQRAPMFVLAVTDVVELDRLRTHEELQEMGKLVEWEDGMGDVMFVSQTWLRDKHPDDEQHSKFELLKAASQGHSMALPCVPLPCAEEGSTVRHALTPRAHPRGRRPHSPGVALDLLDVAFWKLLAFGCDE